MLLLGLAVREVYDLAESSRDDPAGLLRLVRTHHGVGLAAACLPVREDGAIVTFDDAINERKGGLLIDVALEGVVPEYIVEGKWLGRLLGSSFDEIDLLDLVVDVDDTFAICH